MSKVKDDTQNTDTKLEQIKKNFPKGAFVKSEPWMDDILRKEGFSDHKIESNRWFVFDVYEWGENKDIHVSIRWEYGAGSHIGVNVTPEELVLCDVNGEPLKFE